MSRWSGLTNDTSTASMNPSFPAPGRREYCIQVEQRHSLDLTCDAYIQDSTLYYVYVQTNAFAIATDGNGLFYFRKFNRLNGNA